ncbi:ABC transporter permease [Mycobacterium sp. ACS1612]|uniref:ABC transporter permease n=1 Tax=Mycobacterium sp. ACS1612 TaxID=1834117 RepID=UPI0007FF862B|nr:FtsX-like permease family protein [Mycobacterium sp. ACS1612]OBF36769.1 ABC transporter permease [Mycobacterium sp. ACS1612]
MAGRQLAAALSVLRIINLRALRRHSFRALLAAVSLGGGVAVVVAVMIEATSVSDAVHNVGYRIAGPAPLRVVGAASQGGIDAQAIAKVRGIPGVSAAAPVIRAVTLARTGNRDDYVLTLGIDCTARWIIDPAVCPPGRSEPPVPAASTTFATGADHPTTLVTDEGQLPLTGVLHTSQLDTVNDGLAVVLPLSAAKAQFARGDRVDLLYVTLVDDSKAPQIQAQIRAALGPGYSVLTRNDPDAGIDVNAALLPLLGIFALIAVGVGVILIAQITRLSVEERRHEVAVAAALGASPLATVTGFLAEAAVLGALGSAVGVLAGIGIAHPVVAHASALTQVFLGVNVSVVVHPWIPAVGVAMGVLLAVLAAALPGLSVLKTAIASELSGRAPQMNMESRSIWPKAAGLLIVGAAGVAATEVTTRSGGLQQWQAVVASAAVVLVIVGLLSAAAYLSAQLITLLRVPQNRAGGATVRVALTGLRADASRTTAMAGAVAVPVVVASVLSSFLVGISSSSEVLAKSQATGRLVATTSRFNNWQGLDSGFSPETITKLAALPGVGHVERMVEIQVSLADGASAYVRAEDDPALPFPVVAGKPQQDAMHADELIVGSTLARDEHLRVGDSMRLGAGTRARTMVVGSIVATPELGGRRIYLPFPTAQEIYGFHPAGLVRVVPDDGVRIEQIADEIHSATFNQPVRVVNSAGYRNEIADGANNFLVPLNALEYGLLAIAFISVSATLLLVGLRRQREMALIQALGATKSKVFAITTVESIVAGAVGAGFGAVFSVAITEAVRRAAVVVVGSLSPLSFPWPEAIKYSAFAAAAAVVAAVVPAWKNTQAAPATALRDE